MSIHESSGIGTHFGTIAIGKGIIDKDQLIEAMKIQIREDLASSEHRLIGEILIDMGFMNSLQVDEVLKLMPYYEK